MSVRDKKTVDISFVVITYNDAAKLSCCLSSSALAAASSKMSFELIVVDNGSSDHTPQVLEAYERALGDALKIISLGRNTGTTYSRNRALETADGRFICILDSDAQLLDLNLIPVVSFLREFPEVGILGPRIIMPDGFTYDSAKRLPTLTDKFLKLPSLLFGLPPVNRDFYPEFPFREIRCVQTAISCCWFMRQETVERVGSLDERIFYAPEDVDYCLRAWKSGLAVVYYPWFKVLHHTKQVTHKRPLSATALSHLKGLFYYWRKHGYWLSRRVLTRKWVEPIAEHLDPLLRAWRPDS